MTQLHGQEGTDAGLKYVKSGNATIKAMPRPGAERLSGYSETFDQESENVRSDSERSEKKLKIQKLIEDLEDTKSIQSDQKVEDSMGVKIDADLFDYDKGLDEISSDEAITEEMHANDASAKLLRHARKLNKALEQSMRWLKTTLKVYKNNDHLEPERKRLKMAYNALREETVKARQELGPEWTSKVIEEEDDM